MRYRRIVLLTVVVTVVPAMLFGTGSFSAVSAERSTDVAVVDDQDAYLTVTKPHDPHGFVDGDPFTVMQFANRLSGDVDLVSITTGSSSVDLQTSAPANIGRPADPLDVRATCGDSAGTETVAFAFEVEGSGTRVVAERSVDVDCLEPIAVTFNGCGSVTVTGDSRLFPLEAAFTIVHNGTESTKNVGYSHPNETISKGEKGKIAAVDIEGETYKNDESSQNPNSCTSNRNGRNDRSRGGGQP